MFKSGMAVGRLVLVEVGEGGTVCVKVGCGVHVGLGTVVMVETSGNVGEIDGGMTIPAQALKINTVTALTRPKAQKRSWRIMACPPY